MTPVWADASWDRLPTDAEIKSAWENLRAELDREWAGVGKADNFSFIKYYDPALLGRGHLEASGVLIRYDVRSLLPQGERAREPSEGVQFVPPPDRESDPPFYFLATLSFRGSGWICNGLREFGSSEARERWVASLFGNNPPELHHFHRGERVDRQGVAYVRGFARPVAAGQLELNYTYELAYNDPPYPERDRQLRVIPEQNGIAGHLNHFATTVDRPLQIRFHVKNGPPGAYIAGIQSLVLGWDVFHTGKDITDWRADPNTRSVEYAFFGINWLEALDAARSGVPIAFEAELSVFIGYDGREQVFETFSLRGEVRFAGWEGIPVQLFLLDSYFKLPAGPFATTKPGEGGAFGSAGGKTNLWNSQYSLPYIQLDDFSSHAKIAAGPRRIVPDPYRTDNYVCGGWQTKVLHLFAPFHSGDAMQRAALAAFDYGPIHSRWGGHEAVVIYPKGGDWWKGIVLDGWPNQVPEVWTMDLWKLRFGVPPDTWFGIGPSEAYLNQYPITGASDYPSDASRLIPREHRDVLHRLPNGLWEEIKQKYYDSSDEERQTLIDGLLEKYPGMDKSVSVSVESPVRLLITDAENRRAGWVDSETFLYEIPGVDFDEYPKADGTLGTIVRLPMRDYQIRLMAIQSGSFKYSYGIPDAGFFASPFTTVSQGDDFEHQLRASRPDAPLVGPGGVTVAVSATTPEELGILPPEQEPAVASTPQATESDRPPTASTLPADFVTVPPVRDNRRRRVGMHATSADPAAAEAVGLDEVRGVVVKQVAAGSPAATAGLQAADLIVELGDLEIKNMEDLQARLHTAEPGSRLALSILRGRQPLSLELPVALGNANASPLGSYSFPGGGFQFDFLPGWKLDPAPRREEVTYRRYDYLESVENNYQLFLYRDFQGVADPVQALEAFRLRTHEDFLHGQSGWLLFGDIPAVFVAGVVGRERLFTLYRLAIVVQDRLYEVNAFTPPSNDPGKLPMVLESTLGSIRQTAAGIPRADQIQELRQRAMEVWSPPLDPSLDFEEVDQQETAPDGWTKSLYDPNKMVEIFTPLRLKPGYVLRAYIFQEGDNANGIVWAMPETAEFPEPEDCPTLEHHLFQAPKPWEALDDVMEAIEGDGSEWSYLAASLLRRELREFGASWHGIQWGTHYLLEEDPWKKGPPREDDFDLSRPSNPEREWEWSELKPKDWAPVVHVQPNQVTVTYYTYSGKETQRIIRHTETYRPGSYRARVQDQEIATGGWGYLF